MLFTLLDWNNTSKVTGQCNSKIFEKIKFLIPCIHYINFTLDWFFPCLSKSAIVNPTKIQFLNGTIRFIFDNSDIDTLQSWRCKLKNLLDIIKENLGFLILQFPEKPDRSICLVRNIRQMLLKTYNPGQNVWHEAKSYNKIGQHFTNIICNFACFLTAIVNV